MKRIASSLWKTARRSDELIQGFMHTEASKLLVQKIEGSGGLYLRAFLNAAQGERAAFVGVNVSKLTP